MDPFFLWLESTALSTWIREAVTVLGFPMILAYHTIGMGFVAGLSAAMDLRILGVARHVPLLELKRFLPVTWAAFWLNAISGVLLLIAYPTKALTNPLFYLKLIFIGVAVAILRSIANSIIRNPNFDLSEIPARGKWLARGSLFCWTGAIFAGRLLAYTYTRLTAS